MRTLRAVALLLCGWSTWASAATPFGSDPHGRKGLPRSAQFLPQHRQITNSSCGRAAALAVLYGRQVYVGTELALNRMTRTSAAVGTETNDLIAAFRAHGLQAGWGENQTNADLRRALRRGKSVLVPINAFPSPLAAKRTWYDKGMDQGHWMVLVAMDPKRDENDTKGYAYFMDPASGVETKIPLSEFSARWKTWVNYNEGDGPATRYVVRPEETGFSLAKFLHGRAPLAFERYARDMIKQGSVKVGQRRSFDGDRPVRAGQEIFAKLGARTSNAMALYVEGGKLMNPRRDLVVWGSDLSRPSQRTDAKYQMPSRYLHVPAYSELHQDGSGPAALLAALYYWRAYPGRLTQLDRELRVQTKSGKGGDLRSVMMDFARNQGLLAHLATGLNVVLRPHEKRLPPAERAMAVHNSLEGLVLGGKTVLLELGEPAKKDGRSGKNHYVVVVAVNKDYVWVMDPSAKQGKYTVMTHGQLEDAWHGWVAPGGSAKVARTNRRAIVIEGASPFNARNDLPRTF